MVADRAGCRARRGGSLLGLLPTGGGVEACYSFAITPAVRLTLDVQWVDEGSAPNDPATLLGARLHIDF
jgi:hypothetical protein